MDQPARHLPYQSLTHEIIGAAIAVHKELGPGFLESVHENALCIELRHRGIRYQRQLAVPIFYRGEEAGLHRLDLLVEETVVVDNKTVRHIDSIHFVILRSYLHATKRQIGLILNFAKPSLNIKRVTRSGTASYDCSWVPGFPRSIPVSDLAEPQDGPHRQ